MAELHNNSGYERTDAKPWKMIAIGVVSIIILTFLVLGVNEYFLEETDTMVYKTVLSQPSTPLTEMRQREQTILTSYGVADSALGTIRIPIEWAIKLTVEESERP